VKRRSARDDRVIELVDHFGARNGRDGHSVQALLKISVDHYAFRRRAQIGTRARCQKHAKVLVKPRSIGRCGFVFGASVVLRGFQCRLLCGRQAPQGLPSGAIAAAICGQAHLADPSAKFVRIEMTIAAVDCGRERSALEFQQRRIGAFGCTGRIPDASVGANAAYATAAEQALARTSSDPRPTPLQTTYVLASQQAERQDDRPSPPRRQEALSRR